MASGGTVIGFVGTGTMGAPIAGHLVAAGYDVRVHDRSSFAMDGVDGATPVSSAAAAASGARCVFLSLPGPTDVEQAVTGADGVLAADPRPASVVDLSTNSPDVVRRAARPLRRGRRRLRRRAGVRWAGQGRVRRAQP